MCVPAADFAVSPVHEREQCSSTLNSQQPTGLELWHQQSFIDLVEKLKVDPSYVPSCAVQRTFQAHEFVFRMLGDLPDVFAQVFARATAAAAS